MSEKERVITGKWRIGTRFVTGVLDITTTQPSITFHYYGHSNKKLFSQEINKVTTKDSSQDQVTLVNLRSAGDSIRTNSNYREYTYVIEKVLIGQIPSNRKKVFKSANFHLEELDKDFFIPLKSDHKVLENKNLQINLELISDKVEMKGKLYDLVIHYGTRDLHFNSGSEIFGQYAYIELMFHKPQRIEIITNSIQDISELLIFLTSKYRTPRDVHVHVENQQFPIKLIEYKRKNEEKPKITVFPIFTLTKEEDLLKKIGENWMKVFKNNSLNFRLFSSDLVQRGQYLDNSYFNIMALIDNLLTERYGKRFNQSGYAHLPYKYVVDRLSRKKRPSEASFKDKLLRYIHSTNYELHGKFSSFTSSMKIQHGANYDESLADILIKLRDDIAHGKARRNQDHMFEAYLVSKFIALRILLEELSLSADECTKVINGMSVNYYANI